MQTGPDSEQYKEVHAERQWIWDCGIHYWPQNRRKIEALPVPVQPGALSTSFGPTLITLPAWGKTSGVENHLLAFEECIAPGDGPEWQRCDWISVAYHLLSGTMERVVEAEKGPVLSYSFRLPESFAVVFERAWVNRIFMFLRAWAAQIAQRPEEELFGPLPMANIELTHDIDALRLTPEIRLKQTVFQLFNAARGIATGDGGATVARLADARRYLLSRGDFRTLKRLREMETAAGLRSTFHFYGGPPGWKRITPKRILIDPAYDILDADMARELAALADGGWTIGLHQSFDAWQNPDPMRAEKARVEAAARQHIIHCRQHWLRFSWRETWAAQAAAGLKRDTTLGFNDRPGFRSGHALAIAPWDPTARKPIAIEAVPMVFMDSHFYDYSHATTERSPGNAMRHWIDEVRAVGGQATVNWHNHTITSVYGWGSGFESLLEQLA